MARKLNDELVKKLAPQGEYANILKEVIKDKELSLEIREGKAIIYYQKGKILTLSKDKIEYLSSGYYKNKEKNFKFSDEQTKQTPKEYFKIAKSLVYEYGNKKEFTIQQLIAAENSSINNEYLVIDMEYQYKQSDIAKDERLPFTRIDLLAIEKESKDIILFELKQGIKALNGKSGVEEHIKKTRSLIEDSKFKKALLKDVETIIMQKSKLQILPGADKWIDEIKMKATIKPMFIFVYFEDSEKEEYDKILDNRIPTIYFHPNYILTKK